MSRYTPQAVLVANVEEARYEALAGEDGKMLVRARYAVRNNQRSFLAVTLPPQASLWSASLAGRPVRPGLSADGGLLLPLQKGRSGEEAPTFVVELDLHPARRRVDGERATRTSSCRRAIFPSRAACLRCITRRATRSMPARAHFASRRIPGPGAATWAIVVDAASVSAAAAPGTRAEKDLQALMDRYKKESGRSRQGAVPIAIDFPALGPSIFLAAELTAETQAPSIDLAYRRTGGR